MDEPIEEFHTDRAKSVQCQKNPKAVALNILITVDRQKDDETGQPCYRVAKKCTPKVKAIQRTKDACCETDRENCVKRAPSKTNNVVNNKCIQQRPECIQQRPECIQQRPKCIQQRPKCIQQRPTCIPPNSELLPCGCLIVYDQKPPVCNHAGVQCCNMKRSKQQRKCCSKGRGTVGIGCQTCGGQDAHPCIRVRVKKKVLCNKTTAGCQTGLTGIMPMAMPKQIEQDNKSVSVQAFQSQRYIADMPPPPPPPLLLKPSVKPSKSCSRISVKPSASQTGMAPSVKASQQNMMAASRAKSTRVIVSPPSAMKPSAVPSSRAAPIMVSTKATQHIIIAPGPKGESQVMQPVMSKQPPKEQSVVKVEEKKVEPPPPTVSFTAVKPSAGAERINPVEDVQVPSSQPSKRFSVNQSASTKQNAATSDVEEPSWEPSAPTAQPSKGFSVNQSASIKQNGATSDAQEPSWEPSKGFSVNATASITQVVEPSASSSLPKKDINMEPSAPTKQNVFTTEVEEPSLEPSAPTAQPSRLMKPSASNKQDVAPTEFEEQQPVIQSFQETRTIIPLPPPTNIAVSVVQSHQVQSYYNEANLQQDPGTEPSYVEEIPQMYQGEANEDDCNDCDITEECNEDACEDDGCFTFSWSTLKRWDWDKWDKFVALMNGEPTCAPNLCEQECGGCCDDEAQNEQDQQQPCNGWTDGWNNVWNYSGSCNDDCEAEGNLCVAEPMSQETYVLLLALPLVFLGIMASFSTSTC